MTATQIAQQVREVETVIDQEAVYFDPQLENILLQWDGRQNIDLRANPDDWRDS